MDDVDRAGRQAAEALTADVRRRVDVEDALRRLHDPDLAPVVPLDRTPEASGRRGWQVFGAAAAVVVLVAGGIALARRDPASVTPTDTATPSVDTLTSSTVDAPTSSTTPATTPATTGMPSTTAAATTTTVEPMLDVTVDALAAFPSPPVRTPSLDDVPRLLPPAAPVGATRALRSEYADDPSGSPEYTQTWFGEGAGATVLTVTTRLGQPSITSGGEETQVLPWDTAVFLPMAPGYAGLVLDDPSGYVQLWAQGAITRDELVAIAENMTARGDGRPGFELGVVPAGLSAVYEGWYTGAAVRSVLWYGPSDELVAEMSIVSGVPTLFTSPPIGETTVQFADIGGVQGVAYGIDDRSAVVWSPDPDLIVMLGLYGSVDDVVALARSLAPVDEAVWTSSTEPVPTGWDGCNGMFC